MLVNIDGELKEVYPVTDESGAVMRDNGAEIHATADGSTVICLQMASSGQGDSGRNVPEDAASKLLSCPAGPSASATGTTEGSQSCEEALWSHRRSLFLIRVYKEMNERGGFRYRKELWEKLADALNKEFGCLLTALQVHNKWKSLERACKPSKVNNEKSGWGATRCEFEEELAEVLEREHHVAPTILYAPGQRIARQAFQETQPEEEQEPEAEDEAQSEPEALPCSSSQVARRKRNDGPPVVLLLEKLDELDRKRAARHEAKMALLERFVTAYEAKNKK